MPAIQSQLIRVFISSPSELQAEREICERVIRQLDETFKAKARVKPFKYEDKPTDAGVSFQVGIESTANFDIVIGMLWKTLGSPLEMYPDYCWHLKRGNLTGTTCEIFCALDSSVRNGKPSLLVYQKKSIEGGNPDDPDYLAKNEAAYRGIKLVDKFFADHFNTESGSNVHGWRTFRQTAEFEKMITDHLTAQVGALLGIKDVDRWRLIRRVTTWLFISAFVAVSLVAYFQLTAADREKRRLEAEAREKAVLIQKALALTSQASRGAGDVIAQMLVSYPDHIPKLLPTVTAYFKARVDRYPLNEDPGAKLLRSNEIANFAEFYFQIVKRADALGKAQSPADRANFLLDARKLAAESLGLRTSVLQSLGEQNTHALHDIAASQNQLGDITTFEQGKGSVAARDYYEASLQHADKLLTIAPRWLPAQVAGLAVRVRLFLWHLTAQTPKPSEVMRFLLESLEAHNSMANSNPDDAVMTEYAEKLIDKNNCVPAFVLIFNNADPDETNAAKYFDDAIKTGNAIIAMCKRYPAFRDSQEVREMLEPRILQLIKTRPGNK